MSILGQFLFVLITSPLAGQSATRAPLQLRPGDAMRLEVKDEPAMTGQFVIGADGNALLPLVGLVKMTDQLFSSAAEAVQVAYALQLKDPLVRITPLLRVPVLGEVRQPGLFYVDPTQTVADVLASAGGLLPTANRNRVALVRNGAVIATRLDVSKRIPEISLESGDQLVIGRRSWLADNTGTFVGAIATVAAAAITTLIVK